MLKPFAIRRLSGIVQIYPDEYDHTIHQDPKAALTYVDNDDGDKITVGSSFELSQRLDEPGSLVTSHHTSPLQIFDIRRGATETWKDIRDKTCQRDTTPELNQLATETAQGPGKINEAHSACIDYGSKFDLSSFPVDTRKNWLNACQPPKLYHEQGDQAREAGAKFNWKPSSVPERTSMFERPAENRWALYSSSSEKLKADLIEENQTAEKGFLAEFEEELAKVRRESSTTALDKDDTKPLVPHPISSMSQSDMAQEATKERSSPSLVGPGAVLFEVVSALAGGLEMMGTELTKKLPEIERGIANAQQDIPEAFRNTATDFLKVLERPNQQSTSGLGGQTEPEKSEQALRPSSSTVSAEDLFKGFSDLIKDIGDIGKSILVGNDGQRTTTLTRPTSSCPTLESPKEPSLKATLPEHPRRQPLQQDPTNPAPSGKTNPPPKPRTSNDDHPGCLPHCIIGANRSHEYCVTREPVGPDVTDNHDVEKGAQSSHFRLRVTRQAAGDSRDMRSRSPSSTRRDLPLNTKRSVNFVDSKGVVDRQKALEALKRHRSMGSLHSKGKALAATNEAYRPFAAGTLTHERAADNLDGGFIQACQDPPRPLTFHERPYAKPTHGHANLSSNSKAILDQEDSDPDFSMRYPSLLSSGPSEDSYANASRLHMTKSFLSDFNPESEIARYPTVSQLYQQAASGQVTNDDTNDRVSTHKSRPSPPSLKIPGSWPQQEGEHFIEESSGQFFDRMTGRTPGRHIARSNSTTASNPAARLPGPFDPLSDLAHTTREQKRRQSKQEDRMSQGPSIARTNTEKLSSSRRPYSENFTGAGRVPWERFVSVRRAPQPPQPFRLSGQSLRKPTRPTVETFFGQPPDSEGRNAAKAQSERPTETTPPKDKYDVCVDRLKEMGYGERDQVERDRLRLFAVASDGDVESAVDILEEEREASKSLNTRRWTSIQEGLE